MGLFGKRKVSELVGIRTVPDSAVDVIFVHGLDGNEISTWRFDEDPSWHSWISAAVPRANVWSLAYPLRSSNWAGGSMPLTDRAINILATIDATLNSARPIIFVCHSYGGLLVKQLIRAALQTATDYELVVKRVRGVVFLGTPHTGAGLSNLIQMFGFWLRLSTAVRELKANLPLLRDLKQAFQTLVAQRGIKVRVYFETGNTRGLRIVDETSSDPGVAGVTPVAVDANHLELPKPLSPDFRVRQTIALIEDAIERGASLRTHSLFREIWTAPDDQIPFIAAQVRQRLAEDPGDPEALKAVAWLQRMKPAARDLSHPRPSPEAAMPRRMSYGGAILGLAGAGVLAVEHEKIATMISQIADFLKSIF